MMKFNRILPIFLLVTLVFSCEKTDQYVPVPYTCECGRITWGGLEHQVTGVGANYLSLDSLGMPDQNTRKYDVTVSIKDETDPDDIEAHHVNTIFEFEDISNIFYYIYSDTAQIDTALIDTTLMQPTVYISEINHNLNAIPSINYKAIDGSLQVIPSADGSQDEVRFNLTIKEFDGTSTVGLPMPYSGTFTFDWE